MKTSKILFFALFCGIGLAAFADSFLTAQSFPEPFKDISFSDKMDFESKDYAQYAPEYDDKGVCIKNCAFPTLNMKDRTESIEAGILPEPEEEEENTDDIEFDENGVCIKNCVYEGLTASQVEEKINNDTETAYMESTNYQENQRQNSNQIVYNYNCAGRNTTIPIGQKIPISEPVKGFPRISSPFGLRKTRVGSRNHQGIDYAVGVGTVVYAPADGTIRSFLSGKCGIGLKIKHEDGTYTLYCHLSKRLVAKNAKVAAGCPIALSGNTGIGTGPHLHYGMQKPEYNYINPGRYTGRSR